MKNAVIYTRVSSSGDRQTTDRQVADLQAYAAANGIRILQTYTEKISGTVLSQDRPQLSDCLEFCRQNHPELLLVSELSRLGRDTEDILGVVRQLNEKRVSLYIHNMGIQTLQEDGTPNYVASILIPLLSEVARIERQLIKERLESGRERYKREGGQLGRPKGSRKSPEDLVKEYPGIAKRLKQGKNTIEEIAKLEDRSPSTVKKVKKALNIIWLRPKQNTNKNVQSMLEELQQELCDNPDGLFSQLKQWGAIPAHRQRCLWNTC